MLGNVQCNSCVELTIEELNGALNSCRNRKAPGPDGIIVGLYEGASGKLKVQLKIIIED